MIENLSQSAGADETSLSGIHSAAAQHGQSPDRITAGMVLRGAREAAGLHIAALAVALKVPVKKLEALETDRHDLLPDMVFVRALASSVCRNLKIDSAPVLELLPHSGRPTFSPVPAAVQASFSAYQPAAKPTSRAAISAPAAVGGLLLVIGAAVLVLLPSIRETLTSSGWAGHAKDTVLQAVGRLATPNAKPPSAADAGAEPPVPGINEVTGPKAVTEVPGNNTPTADASALTPSPQLVSPRPDTAAAGAAPASAAKSTASAAPAALKSAPDLAVTDALVTFSATTQPSWVKVTDSKGAVVLSRTIAPGEQVAASGALPLVVIVGRADATRVQVRGVAFDLAAYAKENVAKFEVK